MTARTPASAWEFLSATRFQGPWGPGGSGGHFGEGSDHLAFQSGEKRTFRNRYFFSGVKVSSKGLASSSRSLVRILEMWVLIVPTKTPPSSPDKLQRPLCRSMLRGELDDSLPHFSGPLRRAPDIPLPEACACLVPGRSTRRIFSPFIVVHLWDRIFILSKPYSHLWMVIISLFGPSFGRRIHYNMSSAGMDGGYEIGF